MTEAAILNDFLFSLNGKGPSFREKYSGMVYKQKILFKTEYILYRLFVFTWHVNNILSRFVLQQLSKVQSNDQIIVLIGLNLE